ncbi:MAG TPA: hypothetical protein PKE31_20495 [Pseudomonadota bacterium]|nr:hypothetical protein [Pseudomonadota bacterium]
MDGIGPQASGAGPTGQPRNTDEPPTEQRWVSDEAPSGQRRLSMGRQIHNEGM